MTEQQQSLPVAQSLKIKHLYNHFFLLHDFFHKITKRKAPNADFFDLQIQVYNGMKNSVKTGSKLFQGICIGSLCYYFMKGNSIKLKFIFGFLFTYWYNHIMTLGSYMGAFARLPSVYKRTSQYYISHPEEKNLLIGLDQIMEKSDFFEDTQTPLSKLFDEQDEEVSYVSNDFFVKNKDKYLPKGVLEAHYHQTKKLKYLDSFLTRYIYYSFTRWLNRMKMFLSLETTE